MKVSICDWDNCNESLFLPSVSGFPERARIWLVSVWCYQQRKWPHVCWRPGGGGDSDSDPRVVLITPVTRHTNDGITRDNNDFIQHSVSPWRTRISHPITSQKIRSLFWASFWAWIKKLISSLISLVHDNTTLMAADMCQYREICLDQAFCPLSLLILTIIATCFKHLATLGMLLLYSRSSSWKRVSSLTPYSFICFMSVLICIKYWLALL